MMHISMIFDLDACMCDAGFFRVGRTNERTDKPILGVGFVFKLVFVSVFAFMIKGSPPVRKTVKNRHCQRGFSYSRTRALSRQILEIVFEVQLYLFHIHIFISSVLPVRNSWNWVCSLMQAALNGERLCVAPHFKRTWLDSL